MRAVVQRVQHAKVTVKDPETAKEEVTGSIQAGLLVLLGVGPQDGEAEARWLAQKLVNLRIYEDTAGK